MLVRMQLLSDTIFGNGMSIPGAEDMSVLCDGQGFPYYKGGTFKGIFREELLRYLSLTGQSDEQTRKTAARLLGSSGSDIDEGKLIFSDFTMSAHIRQKMLAEPGLNQPGVIQEVLTNLRTFTAIDDSGIVKQGSLRMARCVNQGLSFYSEISCEVGDEKLVREVLGMIKWVGSMRNRGFGKVACTIVEEV